jgi:MFS family permease
LIQGDLHLNFTQMGMLLSAFSWTYTCSQIPVGWLAERYGAHRMLAAGLILWASATIMVGFAHTFSMLLVLRLMLGLGESAGFPCVAKIMAATVPPKGLGTANGIVALGYLSGPVVGTLLGGLLMAHFGWRSAFWVFGALSLLWLLPWSRAARGCGGGERGHGGLADTVDDSQTALAVGDGARTLSSNYTFYFMLNWFPRICRPNAAFR